MSIGKVAETHFYHVALEAYQKQKTPKHVLATSLLRYQWDILQGVDANARLLCKAFFGYPVVDRGTVTDF